MSNEDIINYVTNTSSGGTIILTENEETYGIGVSYNDLQTYLANGIVPFIMFTTEIEGEKSIDIYILSQIVMTTNADNSITYGAIFSNEDYGEYYSATSSDEELIFDDSENDSDDSGMIIK